MYEVSIEGFFCASHRVTSPDHKLEPAHEHDWQVRAVWRGRRLDERGLLVDFVRAEQALKALTTELDGADLNRHPLLAGRPPSAEVLARVLFERLDSVRGSADGLLKSVSVGEAPGCVAVYSRD